MKPYHHFLQGETLIELVVALSILLITLTTSLQVLSTSFGLKEVSKHRVIATNLAREGIEAVRHIRDSNWIQYGSELRGCWNHNNEHADTFDGNTGCSPTTFTEKLAPNGAQRYVLIEQSSKSLLTKKGFGTDSIAPPAIGSPLEETIQNLFENEVTVEKGFVQVGQSREGTLSSNATETTQTYQLCRANENDAVMVSCLMEGGSFLNNTFTANTDKKTPFYREIVLWYPPDAGGNIQSPNASTHELHARVTVAWIEGNAGDKGVYQDVSIETVFTDYYRR